MRYLITDLLDGLEAIREENLRAAEEAYKEVMGRRQEWAEKDQEATARLLNLFNLVPEWIEAVDGATTRRIESIIDELRDIKKRIPSAWVRGEHFQLSARAARARLEQAAVPADQGQLYAFLKAVRDGGETHVSQHAITQAGVKGYTVANIYAAKKRRDDARAARQAEPEQ